MRSAPHGRLDQIVVPGVRPSRISMAEPCATDGAFLALFKSQPPGKMLVKL